MGIPSLNSAIFIMLVYIFRFKDPSLSLRMTPKSYKYNKYPGPSPRKRAYFWQRADFSVLVQENAPFCGRDMTIQSSHISGHKLNCVKTVRI